MGITVLVAVSPATASTLPIDFGMQFHWADCSSPSSDVTCFDFSGHGVIRGLGETTISFQLLSNHADPSCPRWTTRGGVMATAKGKLAFDAALPGCQAGEGRGGTLDWTITSGEGALAGASGSGTAVFADPDLLGAREYAQWSGTINASYVFDTTPPVFAHASSRTVVIRHGRKARVRFTVTASDAVDGATAVTCRPPSGSSFRVGRTRVVCAATDSSGNTATTRFFVVVKRR